MATTSSRLIPIALLLGVFVVAHFSLAWQSAQNGTFTLASVFDYENRILPGTSIPISLPKSGIAIIDNYFAFMMAFFWMALDERNIRAHLTANYLLGTLSGAWVIMLTEAHRRSSTIIFCLLTYFFELMGEFLGIGLFTPLWCAFHLFWTAKSPSRRAGHVGSPPGTAFALGWALVIGHLAPTLIMKHTSVIGEGLLSAQWWTILRLFHPVFVLVAFTVLKTLHSAFRNTAEPSSSRNGSAKFHIFALLASAYGHISTFAVLLAEHWIPGYVRPEVLTELSSRTLVLPVAYWLQRPQVAQVPFVTGVTTFLQWDNICAATATVLWAATLYSEAVRGSRGGLLKAWFEVASTVVQVSGVVVLAGPVAGAAYLLMQRDALAVEILPKPEPGKKKN